MSNDTPMKEVRSNGVQFLVFFFFFANSTLERMDRRKETNTVVVYASIFWIIAFPVLCQQYGVTCLDKRSPGKQRYQED